MLIIRYLFLIVCLYFSARIFIKLYNTLLTSDIRVVDNFDAPINRRSTSRKTVSAKRVTVTEKSKSSAQKSKRSVVDKKNTNNTPMSYASYRANNVVRM